MRAAIVKPDYGIRGGFEIVVDLLVRYLPASLGMEVDVIRVDMADVNKVRLPFKTSEERELHRFPSLMNYIKKLLLFRSKSLHDRLSHYDLVFSTQPPSYAISHPNHFSLFFHHERMFYDLMEYGIRLGVIADNTEEIADYVRAIDAHFMRNAHIIAASENVVGRLVRYSSITPVGIYYAGIDETYLNFDGSIEYGSPICVGRHEFPKRPELFVKAMKELNDIDGALIGSGGRTSDLILADKCITYLTQNRSHADRISEREMHDLIYLGKQSGNLAALVRKIDGVELHSNVTFKGAVGQQELLGEYRKALCVVCPAYDEDYGLTALEAMSMRKPVIACEDGGGYLELVEDGETGLIVPPDPSAIATAIDKLRSDPTLAMRLGTNGFKRSKQFTWDNAVRSIDRCVKAII